MTLVEKYWQIVRILATVGIMSQGLYYAVKQPGAMDVVNGAINGLVLYAIWFARERTKK